MRERRKWARYWLVDPLDGTKEFVSRNGEFTVNIAFIEHSRPVVGAIYAPDKDVFYFAAKKLGAYKFEGDKLAGGSIDEKLMSNVEGGKLEDGVAAIGDCSVRLKDACCSLALAMPITVIGSRSHTTKDLDVFVELM